MWNNIDQEASVKLTTFLNKNYVLGTITVNQPHADEIKKKIRIFTVRTYNDITFDYMAKLSKLFNTRKINLTSEIERGGGCETCSYTKVSTYLTVEIPIDKYNTILELV